MINQKIANDTSTMGDSERQAYSIGISTAFHAVFHHLADGYSAQKLGELWDNTRAAQIKAGILMAELNT
ncbi:hypothetical protein PBI_GAIA_152 [Mycobacterium phage Gaia]|uniref:Uncharacterized protein n=1 Tax=Mycobacterium phage Gaia TaxID=1486472 RepID=A0A068F3N9_9CAUD|nr:hypothetical protein VC46_gp084 [Mycobacterium phage Gaia]AID58968.1 hypothetical protein PBI_GAIA_152 [Mycobacterium phage Gaia]